MLKITPASDDDAPLIAAVIRESFSKQVELLGLSESACPSSVQQTPRILRAPWLCGCRTEESSATSLRDPPHGESSHRGGAYGLTSASRRRRRSRAVAAEYSIRQTGVSRDTLWRRFAASLQLQNGVSGGLCRSRLVVLPLLPRHPILKDVFIREVRESHSSFQLLAEALGHSDRAGVVGED